RRDCNPIPINPAVFFAERSRPFPTVVRCFLIKTGDRKGRPYIILRNHHTSAENLYRIPPVLAKPKPPPFNKGGFQQKCADNIRPYIDFAEPPQPVGDNISDAAKTAFCYNIITLFKEKSFLP
ncbi:MAG: hypothetical protein IJA70_08860, partial [Oscillospiraceae bacterium]|nr:hypothetical protein [Oscillospiraceae bacterium]